MVRDFEREEHEYTPGLRLRALRFVSDTEIEMEFEGLGTDDRRFRAYRSEHGGIPLINYDGEFSKLYRGIPCLSAGHSLNPLIGQAFAARRDQLPADGAWEQAMNDCMQQVSERWNADH